MTDYTAHLERDDRPNLTACGEPWQGWQVPEDADLKDPRLVTLPPHDPPNPSKDMVRQCQACLKTVAIPPDAARLWHRYSKTPHACPDCGRDPAPVNEGPIENPGAAAADHRPPRMALYCDDCKQILAIRYGYGRGAWPSVDV
jgi:hypothetical protein